jgi:hypothetical protein
VETEHETVYPEDCSDIMNLKGVVTFEQGPLYVFVHYLYHFYSHLYG